MSELEQFFCPNEHCKDYGVRATARLLELDKDTVNGDPACGRALRLRALRSADVIATDRGATRRAVDLYKKKESSGSAEDLERQ